MILYGYFMARARLERRSERVLGVLGRVLPMSLKERPLLVVSAFTLGCYVVGITVLTAMLSGLLLISRPDIVLSLLFASLLSMAAASGLSTVSRTVFPPDEERLLIAPLSDRQVWLMASFGGDVLGRIENLLIPPLVSGVATWMVLGDEVSPRSLWITLALVCLIGWVVALVVERAAGAALVRRTRKGARGPSVAAYALYSAGAFGGGVFLSRVLVPWLSDAPMSYPGPLEAESLAAWTSSVPGRIVDAISPVPAHSASPAGPLARWAAGDSLAETGLGLVAPWVASAALAAGILWKRGGNWYRSGWRDGEQGRDLFGLAESLYACLARLVYRKDRLLEAQLRNLCRYPERTASGPFDLFGGPAAWGWVGLAFGASPALRTAPGAAQIFVLLVGGGVGAAIMRVPFDAFRASLSMDAEGRRAEIYRAAGVSMWDVYQAKLRAGRLVGGLPLVLIFVLVAAFAGLSAASCALLAALGVASWALWPHAELLPGLASPHLAWEHPDELGTYHDQRGLTGLAESFAGIPALVGLLLLVLHLGGWMPPESFLWLTALAVASTAILVDRVLSLLGRQMAKPADDMDIPS